MVERLKHRLVVAFGLTRELFLHLDDAALRLDLNGVPANRIAEQAWCIVGARESYLCAIRAGRWLGFSCSLGRGFTRPELLAALGRSEDELRGLPFDALGADQIDLAFLLLEHEVQHHGQLIRYVYANQLSFPESWRVRYTVT
jgi:hypothetical protein